MTFKIIVDGRAVPAESGQSIGAALVAAGITSWRTTRGNARPRGMFCGIGICFDCLLTVDGVPSQRACVVRAAPGMSLQTGDGAADDE